MQPKKKMDYTRFIKRVSDKKGNLPNTIAVFEGTNTSLPVDSVPHRKPRSHIHPRIPVAPRQISNPVRQISQFPNCGIPEVRGVSQFYGEEATEETFFEKYPIRKLILLALALGIVACIFLFGPDL